MSELDARLERIERAVVVMAHWLVQAQTGFGVQDARGIEDIIHPPAEPEKPPVPLPSPDGAA